MAFTPISVYSHTQYLPDHLSIFVEPGISNHLQGVAPENPISIKATESTHLDLTKNFSIDNLYRDQAFQLNTLSSMNLISGAISQHPAFTYMTNETNIRNDDGRMNTFNFKNWHSSNEWIKRLEQFQLHSLKPRNCPRSTDLVHNDGWKGRERVHCIPGSRDNEKCINVSRNRGLEHPEKEMGTSGNVIKISSVEFQSRDVESFKTKAEEGCEIKHSIREILKPRENSRFSNESDTERGTSHMNDISPDNCKGNGLNSGVRQDCPQSFDVIKTDNSSKACHPKLKHRVISVFTMASSSITQNIEIPPSKMSRQLKCQPKVDLLGCHSTYSNTRESMGDFLDTPPISLHTSITHGQSERKTFQCPQCRYLTDRKNNLKRHIVTMHQDSGRVLECCGIPFQSKAALRDHNTIFHRGGYRCQICARNFCRKALLRRHLTVHSGQKDFFCELCGYATSHKSNLERHQKVHTKRTPDLKVLGNKCSFSMNSNVKCQSDNIRVSNFPYTFDAANVNIDIGNLSAPLTDMDSHEPERRYVSDIMNSTISEGFISPTSKRRKRARFFTSRLEETYYDTESKASTRNPFSTHTISDEETTIDQNSKPLVIVHDMERQSGNNMIKQAHSVLVENGEAKGEDQSVNQTFDTEEMIRIAEDIREKETLTIQESVNIETVRTHTISNIECAPSDSESLQKSKKERSTLRKCQKSQSKTRICPVFYECDDCGQKMPSQYELQSHSCPKTLPSSIFDISLVTALHKGCLKSKYELA